MNQKLSTDKPPVKGSNPERNQFAKNLSVLMKRNHLSVKSLANMLSLAGRPTSEVTIYNWLNGVNIPVRSRLKILADLFQITEEQLTYQPLPLNEGAVVHPPKMVPSREPQAKNSGLQYRFLHLVTYIEKHHIVDYSVLIKTLMLEPQNDETEELERATILQFPQQTIEFLRSKRSW